MKSKNKVTIGIDAKAPKASCDDKKCPFHGRLKVRGKTFTGTVIKEKFAKSPVIEWTEQVYVPKFERYKKIRTRVHVHNPPCINAKLGDNVKIAECRPLSKTKNFVIIEKIGREAAFELKAEGMEESKVKEKEGKEDASS